jgi:hypothetical protein
LQLDSKHSCVTDKFITYPVYSQGKVGSANVEINTLAPWSEVLNGPSASPDVLRILWKVNVHCGAQKSPMLADKGLQHIWIFYLYYQ